MIKAVADYYDTHPQREWERLNTPYSRIELTTTLYLIDKYFIKQGRTLDIGSGPGRYALALAEKGHAVTLVDISAKELELAKDHFKERNLTAEDFICMCGSELDNLASESYDSVLVMGPLYHIHDSQERHRVIEHVHRLLKPGGHALFAYINVFGVLKSSTYECPDLFTDHEAVLTRLMSGNVAYTHEESFTASFFVKPEEALKEVMSHAFDLVTCAGAEAFLSGQHLEVKALYTQDPALYDNYLKMACETCELEAYKYATEHFNIVVRKPEQ